MTPATAAAIPVKDAAAAVIAASRGDATLALEVTLVEANRLDLALKAALAEVERLKRLTGLQAKVLSAAADAATRNAPPDGRGLIEVIEALHAEAEEAGAALVTATEERDAEKVQRLAAEKEAESFARLFGKAEAEADALRVQLAASEAAAAQMRQVFGRVVTSQYAFDGDCKCIGERWCGPCARIKEIQEAFSSDAGRGWLSPAEAEALRAETNALRAERGARAVELAGVRRECDTLNRDWAATQARLTESRVGNGLVLRRVSDLEDENRALKEEAATLRASLEAQGRTLERVTHQREADGHAACGWAFDMGRRYGELAAQFLQTSSDATRIRLERNAALATLESLRRAEVLP